MTTTDGTKPASSSTVSFAVLVDVDDDVRRRELADPVDVDVLRAADLGDAPHDLARMDAEAGAPDELRGQAEVAEQLGDARHEPDDARVAAGDGMLGADRVDERHYMFRRYSPPTA